MALPNAATVKSAIESLYAVVAEDKTVAGSRDALAAITGLQYFLNTEYPSEATITVTDATDANVAAFIGGGEGDALSANSVFRVAGTGDLTDNALATAKGSAVAANDVFAIDAAGTGVVWLANDADKTFDYSGESQADFEA